jgi:hypothetical protein
VVVTGSGTMNLSGVNSEATATGYNPGVYPTEDNIASGPANSSFATDIWFSPTGPSSFGWAAFTSTLTGTGNFVEFQFAGSSVEFGVPTNYVSNTALSDTSTYSNTTLSAMGLTPGTSYAWSWTAGTTTDTVNVNVAAVPEPASLSV